MAYDFPNSPTEGLEYTPAGGVTYIYRAPRWEVKPPSPVIATISDTAPSSPVNGMLWWNSTNGNLYIYYDDGAGAQWVQINTVGT